jgi:HSP20 family protein
VLTKQWAQSGYGESHSRLAIQQHKTEFNAKENCMKEVTKAEKRTPATQQNNQAAYRETLVPQVNIYETKEGYLLEAEMPGVSKEGLEITLEDNELTIVGRRSTNPLPGTALFKESREADYQRVFELDPAIDTSKVNAKMDQGVLLLTLPKSERVKPRKINVD